MNNRKPLPVIRDATPCRAQYYPGDAVNIEIELYNPATQTLAVVLSVAVTSIEQVKAASNYDVILKPRSSTSVTSMVDECAGTTGGFGVEIRLMLDGCVISTGSTAYDVVQKWTDAPRYGFLSGFYRADEGDCEDIAQMRKYHINVVQFYDWMYKHHELLPREDYFTDPLGRELSLVAVREKIALCHAYGMMALAYGAVYTAGIEFAAQHPGMMLWKNNGQPETFAGGWLNIMDVSEGSEWAEHIVGQYARAVRELGFDGVHMDTYGYPKTAFSKVGGQERLVYLEEEYSRLIDNTKHELSLIKPDAGVIFNAVGNWPTADVAKAAEDAVYVEVWDPHSRYIHLHDIIEDARQAGHKPVILAAYIKPFKEASGSAAENALLLASAVIFASGGYQVELGENNGVLCDPYYVDYATIRKPFERTLRSYYDFIVRYTELMYDMGLKDVSMTHANGINEEYVFAGGAFSSFGEPGKVWTIVKEKPGLKVIHFINFTGLKSDRWNEGKRRPKSVHDISVCVLDNERATDIYMATPDGCVLSMKQLAFIGEETHRGRAVRFTVPRLEFWTMVCIKSEY